MSKSGATMRWLGVAGFEIAARGRTILVDPYLTRISFFRQWAGRVRPNAELVRRTLTRCDAILITHSHYDHLMDAPAAAEATGAHVYGSPNTCALLKALGVEASRVHEIGPGSAVSVDGIAIEVHEALHPRLPAFKPGPLSPRLRPPLPARAYRMDVSLCFRISAGSLRVLTDPGMVPVLPSEAEVLFLAPHLDEPVIEGILRAVRPRLVIPTHWDNMWRTLLEPLRPALAPPRGRFPLGRRIDVGRFRRIVERSVHRARVFVPERLEEYDLAEILG